MSKNKMTLEEWIQKAAWEGGLAGALEYGLSYNDLDDEARETDFGVALKDLQKVWPIFESAERLYIDAADDLDIDY